MAQRPPDPGVSRAQAAQYNYSLYIFLIAIGVK